MAILVESLSGPSTSQLSRNTGTLHRHSSLVGLERSPSSSSSMENAKSAVRMVGRGGRGSIARSGSISFTSSSSLPQSSSPPISASKFWKTALSPSLPPNEISVPPTKYRVGGRGGLGSKPRPPKSPKSAETRSISSSIPEETPVPSKIIRMGGRGGAGSKPRQIKSPEKSKSLGDLKAKLKGKGKSPSTPSSDTLSFDSESTDAKSFVSSIHFSLPRNPLGKHPRAPTFDAFGRRIPPPSPSPAANTSPEARPQTPSYYYFPHPEEDPDQEVLDQRYRDNATSMSKAAKTLGAGVSTPFNFNPISKRRFSKKLPPQYGSIQSVEQSPPISKHPHYGDVSDPNQQRYSIASYLSDSVGPDGIPHPPSPMMFASPPSPPAAPHAQLPNECSPRMSRDTQDPSLEADCGDDMEQADQISHSPSRSSDDDEPEDFHSQNTHPVSPQSRSSSLPSYDRSVSVPEPDHVLKPSFITSSPMGDAERHLKLKPSTDTFGNLESYPYHHRLLVRKENDGTTEWQGEWNQQTLSDVVSKLRALR